MAQTAHGSFRWLGHRPHEAIRGVWDMAPGQPEAAPVKTAHDYFKEKYRSICYRSENEIPTTVAHWICEQLNRREEFARMEPIIFVLTSVIGDYMWAMLK